MESQENKTPKTENNTPSLTNTTSQFNSASKSEPITPIQADSVITQNKPSLGFRITVTAIALALLFVIAIYYGIINV